MHASESPTPRLLLLGCGAGGLLRAGHDRALVARNDEMTSRGERVV